MAKTENLVRDLRQSEYERSTAFTDELMQVGVPEHLINALNYRCGFDEGRKHERRLWEERRAESRRYYERRKAELETENSPPEAMDAVEASEEGSYTNER